MALDLTIVTPEGEAFSGTVETVVLPGAEGEFGVLERHERSLAPLQPGPVQIKTGQGSVEWAAVSDGFADVSAEQVVVLVDRCALGRDIDRAEAEGELQQAQAELDRLSGSEEDLARRSAAEARIRTAEIWLDVAGRG
ncbi:MAG: ATP synthase F1 subunit epsilon [Myxococcota bacterium]